MQQSKQYQSWWRVSLSVLAVGVSMGIIQYKVATILTFLMDMFALDAMRGSLLMSVFTSMMLFTAVPFGALAQRVNPKTIIACAAILMVIGSIVGTWAPNGNVLLFSRALEGIAITAVTTCGPIIVQRCVAPDRIGSAMGIWGTWGSFGAAISSVFTPAIFAAFGFRALWLIYAVIVTIATMVMCLYVKMHPVPRKEDKEILIESADERTDVSIDVQVTHEKPRYAELLTRDVLLFFTSFAIFNLCLVAVMSIVPTLLQLRGMSPMLSGLASTIPTLLSLVSSPLFGILSDKTGKTKALTVFCLAFLGPCAFVMYVADGAMIWVAGIVMGLIGMGSIGLVITAFIDVLPRPELANIGMGVLIAVQGIGQMLGSVFVQWLLGPDFANVVLAGSVIMVIGLGGALCMALCKTKH